MKREAALEWLQSEAARLTRAWNDGDEPSGTPLSEPVMTKRLNHCDMASIFVDKAYEAFREIRETAPSSPIHVSARLHKGKYLIEAR